MNAESSSALARKRKSLSDNHSLAAIAAPPASKKIKRPSTVLDEDTYLDGLSRIIARDYFPGLATTDAKRDFLDALESRDEEWIQETSSRLNLILDGHHTTAKRGVYFTHTLDEGTPRDFVGNTPSGQTSKPAIPARPRSTIQMSLATYQAKYTSEDNESFNALVDKQNQRNRERHAYLYAGNQIPSSRQLAWREREARLLEAAKSSMDLALYRRDQRPAMPSIKSSAPRNSLMFLPDSIEDTHDTIARAAEARSNAPPKAIVYDNTRLTNDGLSRPILAPLSPSLSAIDVAIAGRPRLTSTEAGWETPRVAGYAFVDADPTLEESQAYNGKKSHRDDAMATLSRITKNSEAHPNPFVVTEATRREKLHHRMVDELEHGHRAASVEKSVGSSPNAATNRTATPKFSSAPKKSTGHLTPAARLLYSKFQRTGRNNGQKVSILDFDMTPKPTGSKKVSLLPGLTPKPSNTRM